jgi:hypothetical protein
LTSSCCTKTATHNDFLSVTPIKAAAKQNLMYGFSVLPLAAPASSGPMLGYSLFAWHCYALPPPPDLVITLKHFLI